MSAVIVWVLAALLVSGLGVLLLPALGRPQLSPYDEAFHAVGARYLLDHPCRVSLYDVPLLEAQRPDWMLGRRWSSSPPLAVWQMTCSLALFGVTTLALRLPSALLHAGAALLTYRIGRDLFGPAVGAAAAFLQAFSPQLVACVLGYHASGHLHIAVLFWTEAGLLALIRGTGQRSPLWFGAAGAALGLALLAGAAPALSLAGLLLGAWAVSRIGFASTMALRVRARDIALVLGVAALPVGLWFRYGMTRDRSQFLRDVEGWFRAPEASRFAPPWEMFGLVREYLPGLAPVALLAGCIVTARAARHRGDLFLGLWLWVGVLPVGLATGAWAGAAVVALPGLLLALIRLVDLAARALEQRARLREVSLALGTFVLLGVIAGYGFDSWRIARQEAHDTALVEQAARLRADFPADAVFLMDEQDPRGTHLSLTFWSGRPVHNLALLRPTNPWLATGISAGRVRKLGGIPYFVARGPVPDAPPPADSVGPYLVYQIGETPTGAPAVHRADASPAAEWAAYGGAPGGTKYSPVADIDRSNVSRLQLAWIWHTGERPLRSESARRVRPGRFEATPLMIGDTLFLTTPYHRVVALDAETGGELWNFDPMTYQRGQPVGGYGFVHRGLAAWSNGSRRRLFHASRGRLFALDAATGELVLDFGTDGTVDLVKALGWSGNPEHLDNTSPPVVYGDFVIVGSSIPDQITYPGDPPGAVVAFDARTGRRVWTFHTIPRAGEPGYETWGGGTEGAGHANVWAPMVVDTARGLVYLPVGAASNDWYGGRRPGANLFSESLVCLDARTGKRKWHFQTVHHGLWDYDLAAPPLLATVRRGDRTQDVVAVATKTGFVFVFDRATGTPVWPIEERAVPASDVPGEATWPTQPFPTRPAPFVRQGFSEADIIDFTPRVRDSMHATLRGVRFGPMFTPPSRAGTVIAPGWLGGAAWGGGAYDPETQLFFIKGNNQPIVIQLTPAGRPSDTVDADFIGIRFGHRARPAPGAASADASRFDWLAARQARVPPPLPVTKPPYGTVTAIDLATGEHRWQATVGHWPDLANHPSLRGIALPPLGAVGVAGPMATGGGLVFIAGGSTSVHALDSRTGRQLWEAPLGGVGHANPMTYRTRNGRQFMVIASTSRHGAHLLAYALPWR